MQYFVRFNCHPLWGERKSNKNFTKWFKSETCLQYEGSHFFSADQFVLVEIDLSEYVGRYGSLLDVNLKTFYSINNVKYIYCIFYINSSLLFVCNCTSFHHTDLLNTCLYKLDVEAWQVLPWVPLCTTYNH